MKMVLSQRERKLLMVAAVFFLLLVYWLSYMQPYIDTLQQTRLDISTTQDRIDALTVQAKQVLSMDEESTCLDEKLRAARKRLPYALDRPEVLQYLDEVMAERVSTEFLVNQTEITAPFREVWVSVRTIGSYETLEAMLTSLEQGEYMCYVDSYTIAQSDTGVTADMMLCFLTHDDPAWDTSKAQKLQEMPGGKADPFR